MFLFSRKPDHDPVPTDPGKSVPFGFRLSLLDFIDDEDNIENKKVVYKDINAVSQWNANKNKDTLKNEKNIVIQYMGSMWD